MSQWGLIEKPRSSVIFHELEENYQRTDNGLSYDYTSRHERVKDSDRPGAHAIAKEKEKNFHQRSVYPGAISKVKFK